jgi:hypothetical protein
MAKKYTPDNKAQRGKAAQGQTAQGKAATNTTPSKTAHTQGRPVNAAREPKIPAAEAAALSPANSWLAIIVSLVIFFILSLAGSMDNIVEKWTGLLAAVVTMILLFTAARKTAAWQKSLSPLFLSFSAYVVWAGISTLYAASGKFAIFEFSKLLVAFCVFLAVLFLTDPSETGFKRISYIFAYVGCFFGIVSVDAASSGFIANIFRAFIRPFTQLYDSRGAFEQGVRITGILGNPNTYAGFMALAVLLSLYLVTRAAGKKECRVAASLLAINSLSYLLAFSMGSLFVFLIACLAMVGISEKGKRVSLFILMLETAVLAFLFAFLSMAGLGKTGAVSFIPLAALILNAVGLYLLDGRLRQAVADRLNANVKLLLSAVLVIVILIAGYTIAALQISGSMNLNANETVMRAIYVPGGDYTLGAESSAPVNIRIESQNRYDLMRHTSTLLFSGTNEQAIPFSVPEDSEIVLVNFSSSIDDTAITKASYSGAESGSVHLNYPLLPDIIANRIQNLFANENAVQRVIFFEDGLKLFSKSPIIGRGLGGFENGVYSVQDFYYETKYAHNHYIQALSDLGLVGLILFLAVLAFSVIPIIRSKKRALSLFAIPVLSACVVQIFGQAAADATWSTGVFLGFAAAILALITIFCSTPVSVKKAPATGRLRMAVKVLLAVFTGVFILLLFGNLYAQTHAKAGVKSFDDIERLILLDRFEYNDYKVSYIVNAPKSDDQDVLAKANVYAEELMRVESNSIAPYVMAYDFETYQDYDAFEAAKSGIKHAASNPGMWTRIFDICEEYIDPVGPNTDDAADRLRTPKYYVKSVVELYNALLERNEHSLDKITLSPYNEAFIGKNLEISATHLYSIDWVFTAIMTYAFDSECAVDADSDGIPDNLSLSSGSIARNHDNRLAVTDGTVIDLTLYHKLHGKYTFKIETETPQGIKISADGTEQNVVYTDKEAYIELDQADNSDQALTKFTVTFPAAAVINAITYTTELE